MKIHVGNFNTTMSDLLSQLNSKNGLKNANAEYKKVMFDVKPKIQSTNEKIDKNIGDVKNIISGSNKDLRGYVDGKHDLTVNQINQNWDKLNGHEIINGQLIKNNQDRINAVQQIEHKIHDELGQQINDIRQANQNIINNNIPQATQSAMAQVRSEFPTNEVCYMPTGEFPSNATPGDICWQSGNFNSNTNINARAYRYDGSQWSPVKVDMDIFGDNIFGAEIHGGNIYGANFVSEEHGIDGKSNFSVSPEGDIYARNFTMDLMNYTSGNSLNRISYNTDMQPQSKGLSFSNGVLTMDVDAHQDTGIYVKGDVADYDAITYLEPDYLKLRANPIGGDGSYTYARTDIRGGNLEVSDNWNQNTGVRLGYWDNGSGQNGPEILVGDLTRDGSFSSIGLAGIITSADINARNIYSQGSHISSDRSLKKEITNTNAKTALAEVLGTDIKSWRYKTDKSDKRPKNIGPIIDDLNSNKDQKYYTPNNLIMSNKDGDAFIQNNAISYLFLSIQELEKQNSQLTQRVAKLEFEK